MGIDRIFSIKNFYYKNDLVIFETVQQFMIHDPCGSVNPFFLYMMDNKYTKHFLKKFNDTTMMDSDGFLVYR